MILPLQLRYRNDADGLACAWFLPGASVERWLEELSHAGLANVSTRLFIVPESAQSPTPAGVLAVPGRPDAAPQEPGGIPCQLIAGRLYLPLDAQLHPQVTDDELRALCALPVCFYHPAFGLSGFEEESALRVWHLLDTPIEREEQWNAAQPGAPLLPLLNGITLAQPPSLSEMFGGAEKEIGTEGPRDLPPAPDEPKQDGLADSGRTLRRFLAGGLAKVLGSLPHTGSRRTWVNDAEDWARRQLNAVDKQLDQLRNKELHRLLHMLSTDPEAGLRHAIPMSGFAHRGIAPPSGRLGPRSLSFDPASLGGGPADFWDVRPELQEILRRRYRALADREMQLGRHRRAAYIYAELLGDLVGAANALKQGRHFREAALLYDEHLKNPLEAAKCLAEGGLLSEAIERFEKLQRWLEVADLHERLGQHREAETAVRRVVHERLAQEDILGAAKLVDERLKQTDEALELLLRAWPDSRQAAGCVSALFQLYARLGRHPAALERIAQFGCEPVSPRMVLPLLTALGGTALDYPHATVRHRAADFSRILIARELSLPSLPTEEASGLLQRLAQLSPQDRLLTRDTNRHLAGRRSAELRVRRVAPAPSQGARPVVVRHFELPRQIEWLQLRREWHWFYAVGITPKRLTLVRGTWEGEFQSLSWDFPAQVARDSLVFEPTGERGEAVAIAALGGPPLPQQKFPATYAFFDQACQAGTPTWLPLHGLPFAFGDESCWSGHVAAGRAVLACHDKRGKLRHSIDVTEDLLIGAQRENGTRLCLTAIGNGIAIALGDRLALSQAAGQSRMTQIALPGQVVGLVPTLPHTRQGVLALLEHGASLHWLGTETVIRVEQDIASPHGAFVPGGPLVLVSGSQMVLLDVDSRGVTKVTRAEHARPCLGVVQTASPGKFAVLDIKGEVTVYHAAQ